ncbi:MAG: ribonuclease P protein component [Rubrivivax sp.]|nr:ribonuclease P protein component [Rubrivivax sp.]MDP3085456.1 ribonuclease P protein component [Rubrivivax sp.]
MIGRLLHTADFQRILATSARCRSAHFAVHHLAGPPQTSKKPRIKTGEARLSTGDAPLGEASVDNQPGPQWLGCVVPKRHARRSVTRSLFKRQIRAAMARYAPQLPAGMWLVRLRSPFPKQAFPSACSDALRQAAGAELDGLFARARA